MSRIQARNGTAQDAAYAWLKAHVASVPRNEGIFLSEAEVGEETGSSRTPVREAFLRLEAEGALQIVPKKGAFVPPISDSEVGHVMEGRRLVEEYCVRASIELPGLAEELERLLSEQLARQNEPAEFIALDREFHRTYVQAAGNPVLVSFYGSLRDRQLRMGLNAITSSEERMATVVDEHRRIIDAIRATDAAAAVAAVADHLQSTLAVLQQPVGTSWSH